MNVIQTESDRDTNEHTISFSNFFLDFVIENVAVITDYYTEIDNWLNCTIELVKYITDCLWSIPVSRFAFILESYFCNVMYSKRTSIVLNVI